MQIVLLLDPIINEFGVISGNCAGTQLLAGFILVHLQLQFQTYKIAYKKVIIQLLNNFTSNLELKIRSPISTEPSDSPSF